MPLFINARTDVYLRGVGEPETRVEQTLARAKAYTEAGASGIFVPGVVDADTVRTLVSEISLPLNVMAGVGAPSVKEFGALGVARVSIGPALSEIAYAVTKRGAEEVLSTGTYESLAGGLTYGELNDLFRR